MQGDMACLSVLDEGPGVPSDRMGHIFERGTSYREDMMDESAADLALKTRHQGLGLWIVRRNIEGLGGTVSARNRTRGGFGVIVCLPGED
jgi:two-component system sensor histidine kinase ChvG